MSYDKLFSCHPVIARKWCGLVIRSAGHTIFDVQYSCLLTRIRLAECNKGTLPNVRLYSSVLFCPVLNFEFLSIPHSGLHAASYLLS